MKYIVVECTAFLGGTVCTNDLCRDLACDFLDRRIYDSLNESVSKFFGKNDLLGFLTMEGSLYTETSPNFCHILC